MPWDLVPVKLEEIGCGYTCSNCKKTYTRKDTLERHIKDEVCTKPKPTKKQLVANFETMSVRQQSTDVIVKQLQDQIAQLTASQQSLTASQQSVAQLATSLMIPSVNNQNLSILCLGSKDNLLDILESTDGLPQALSYLKGCALARLAGDCRILERAYKLDTAQAALMYANKSKTKFVYYDERQRRTVETNKEVMAKKLTDILQRSYLKGMGCFRTDILENQRTDYVEPVNPEDMPELDPYDVQIWNAHIHQLADETYQKKVLKNLKIPIEPPRD